MTHEEIKALFSEVYNKFYLTYRDKGQKRTDGEWATIVQEARNIAEKYNNAPLAMDMVLNLLRIFQDDDEKYNK